MSNIGNMSDYSDSSEYSTLQVLRRSVNADEVRAIAANIGLGLEENGKKITAQRLRVMIHDSGLWEPTEQQLEKYNKIKADEYASRKERLIKNMATEADYESLTKILQQVTNMNREKVSNVREKAEDVSRVAADAKKHSGFKGVSAARRTARRAARGAKNASTEADRAIQKFEAARARMFQTLLQVQIAILAAEKAEDEASKAEDTLDEVCDLAEEMSEPVDSEDSYYESEDEDDEDGDDEDGENEDDEDGEDEDPVPEQDSSFLSFLFVIGFIMYLAAIFIVFFPDHTQLAIAAGEETVREYTGYSLVS